MLEGEAMDVVKWLECADPWRMLSHLSGKVSERKLRLFACACCRRIWHLLADERLQQAVEVAEAHADGLASAEALRVTRDAASTVWRTAYEKMTGHPPPEVISFTSTSPSGQPGVAAYVSGYDVSEIHTPSPQAATTAAASAVHRATAPPRFLPATACGLAAAAAAGEWEETNQCPAERAAQVVLLRELLGNPWKPVSIAPAVLDWEGGMVINLAEAIYEDRTFDRLPILADALEDAGCESADLLGHLRGPGPHVRGCWALDLILGKQ
jgi:hypothetical protein